MSTSSSKTIPSKTIHVSASRSYDVHIGRGLLEELGVQVGNIVPGRRCMIVTDSNVAPLYLGRAVASMRKAGFEANSFSFPAGEASKNGQIYLTLLNLLAEKGLTRADVLVALGGGVVGDLTGFAAATYLRGVALVQVPTTLLACVDSSVGGKTAIDLPAGKNLAGAFYQPSLVLCDTALLDSLPEEVFAEGCAEVVKYGMLGSAELLERLMQLPMRSQLEYVIAKCVDMKRAIVENDEYDTGRRQLLNFGHTFAHSIENLSGYTIPHGRAVAMGMCIVTRAALRRGLCPEECLGALYMLLKGSGLPVDSPFSPAELAQHALSDKKRSGERITLVLPCGWGEARLVSIPVCELEAWAQEGAGL